MFSRLALQAGEIPKRLSSKYLAVALSSSASENANAPISPLEDLSKRDLVNFPRMKRLEYTPPVKALFIPQSWLDDMYPKTGVTGPGVLFVAFFTTLLSKEIILQETFLGFFPYVLLIYYINHNYGDKIAEYYNKKLKEDEFEINKPQIEEKEIVTKALATLTSQKYPETAVHEISKVMEENILMQMEAAYRERLLEVYKKVKQRLDYQVEMENVERTIFQKNLVDYVVRNVKNSITPEQEKNALQSCINNLNTLAIKP